MVIELSPLTVTPLLTGYIEFLGQLNTSCWPANTSRLDGFFPGGSVDILFSSILTGSRCKLCLQKPAQSRPLSQGCMTAIISRISSEIGGGTEN